MTFPYHTAMQTLDNWKEQHDTLQRMFEGIESSMGLDPCGPLFVNVWGLFDAYTAGVMRELGDTASNWMQWFAAENDMGRLSLPAGYDGNVKPIRNTADLYELIVEGRKRMDTAK